MNAKEIGAKIAALRKKQGITQEALAEQVGVSAQAVSKWENGWNLPDYDNLTEIAKALNISQTAFIHISLPPVIYIIGQLHRK